MNPPFVHVAPDVFGALVAGEEATLDRDAAHHLTRVLRREPGDAIVVADGVGAQVAGVIVGSAGGQVRIAARGESVRRAAPRVPRLHVLQALPRGRKIDEVVRTLTELGVDALTVVTTATSASVDRQKYAKVVARWHSVATSAAAQSRRADLPVIRGPLPLSEAVRPLTITLSERTVSALCLVAHPGAAHGLRSVLEAMLPPGQPAPYDEVALLIGPESGFTDQELAELRDSGWHAVAFGEGVLRTEHAGMVGLTALRWQLGELD